MSTPEQLTEPTKFPEDLKTLLAQLKIPNTDPILPLLAWIWKQMADTKTGLDEARAQITAVFDERLSKLDQTTKLLTSVDENLKSIDEQLRAKPLQVKEQVQEELADPIKKTVESCQKLDQQMKSLLQRLDHKIGRNQRSINKALLAAGLTGGGLIGVCLGHLLASL